MSRGRIRTILTAVFAAAVVLAAGLASAADYLVTDQASCEAFLAAVGASGSWAAGPACAIAGTIPADAHLTATGSVALRLANLGSTPSSLTNLGTITVNATSGGTFADKAQTVPVTSAAACPQEFKATRVIARSRQAVRDAVANKCNDTVVATLGACALTVDGLVAPDATAGCLITGTDASTASQIKAEYGY